MRPALHAIQGLVRLLLLHDRLLLVWFVLVVQMRMLRIGRERLGRGDARAHGATARVRRPLRQLARVGALEWPMVVGLLLVGAV